jgi:hypothetical protein
LFEIEEYYCGVVHPDLSVSSKSRHGAKCVSNHSNLTCSADVKLLVA